VIDAPFGTTKSPFAWPRCFAGQGFPTVDGQQPQDGSWTIPMMVLMTASVGGHGAVMRPVDSTSEGRGIGQQSARTDGGSIPGESRGIVKGEGRFRLISLK
jgi:hypothetical protein